MKALIIAGRGQQDVEFVYPFYRLQEAGYEVDVAVRGKQPCAGIIGIKIDPTRDIPDRWTVGEYQILVLPGGVKAMEHMRLDRELVRYIADFHMAEDGIIASICSGAQLLISAGLVRGRKISGYYSMQIDIENAGGTFVDAPAVVDDRIVSSPHYRHLGPWMAAVLSVLRETGAIVGGT